MAFLSEFFNSSTLSPHHLCNRKSCRTWWASWVLLFDIYFSVFEEGRRYRILLLLCGRWRLEVRLQLSKCTPFKCVNMPSFLPETENHLILFLYFFSPALRGHFPKLEHTGFRRNFFLVLKKAYWFNAYVTVWAYVRPRVWKYPCRSEDSVSYCGWWDSSLGPRQGQFMLVNTESPL